MHSAPRSISKVRILAVDDRPENLVALEAAFAESEYDLVTANSGPQAIAITKEDDFAAILLDVQMPGMDGFQTARIIRAHEGGRATPIIFVTAIHRSEQYELQGYVSGAVDFLFKPLDTEILMAKIGVFAELHRAKKEIQRLAEVSKQEALKAQELEFLKRALAVRDEFLSVASHELSTPMTPLSLQMQFFLKMIREDRLKNIEPERLERMLENAFGQVERLARIVRELVDVSRISNGKMKLDPGEHGLADIVESVLGEFAAEIHKLGCDVRFVAEANPVGNWDRTRIEQVVVNLLSNALKYGLGRPVHITTALNGEQAVLKVRDHGIGIAKEDQERIFKRYERAVSPRHFGGLGLGLFITGEIVRLHGGAIAVESAPDEGATFIVEFPMRRLSTQTVDSPVDS
jgi:signal transduction histidine kinase